MLTYKTPEQCVAAHCILGKANQVAHYVVLVKCCKSWNEEQKFETGI